MTEIIDEPIEVIVAYKHGQRAMPTVMGWQHRIYKFTRLGFLHPTHQGNRLIHVFTMSDDNMSYRLEFDTQSLNWKLKEISDGLPS